MIVLDCMITFVSPSTNYGLHEEGDHAGYIHSTDPCIWYDSDTEEMLPKYLLHKRIMRKITTTEKSNYLENFEYSNNSWAKDQIKAKIMDYLQAIYN